MRFTALFPKVTQYKHDRKLVFKKLFSRLVRVFDRFCRSFDRAAGFLPKISPLEAPDTRSKCNVTIASSFKWILSLMTF